MDEARDETIRGQTMEGRARGGQLFEARPKIPKTSDDGLTRRARRFVRLDCCLLLLNDLGTTHWTDDDDDDSLNKRTSSSAPQRRKKLRARGRK